MLSLQHCLSACSMLSWQHCHSNAGEVLDLIIMEALGAAQGGEGQGGSLGLAGQIGVALKGLNRFMRQLSQ